MNEHELKLWEVAGAKYWANCYQYNFRQTGNPYFIWEAIRLSGIAGEAIPKWTLGYLHQCANQLVEGESASAALGLNIGKGKTPLIKRFREELDRDLIGVAVEDRINTLRLQHGTGVKDSAFKQIADEMGKTPKQVRQCYDEWTKKASGQ